MSSSRGDELSKRGRRGNRKERSQAHDTTVFGRVETIRNSHVFYISWMILIRKLAGVD